MYSENTDGNFYVGTTDALAIVSLSGGLSVTETISEIKYAKSLSTDAVGTVAAVTDEGCLYLLNGSKIVTKKEKSISGTAYTCCTFDDAGKLYLGTQENSIEVYRFENETLKKEKVISCRDMINIKSLQQSEDGFGLSVLTMEQDILTRRESIIRSIRISLTVQLTIC